MLDILFWWRLPLIFTYLLILLISSSISLLNYRRQSDIIMSYAILMHLLWPISLPIIFLVGLILHAATPRESD